MKNLVALIANIRTKFEILKNVNNVLLHDML